MPRAPWAFCPDRGRTNHEEPVPMSPNLLQAAKWLLPVLLLSACGGDDNDDISKNACLQISACQPCRWQTANWRW